MSRLTGLSYLCLAEVTLEKPEDIHPLRALNLLELSLRRCTGVAEPLLVSGALTSLQCLHVMDVPVEQAISPRAEEEWQAAAEVEAEGGGLGIMEASQRIESAKLIEKFILLHPSLNSLSGGSCLFSSAGIANSSSWCKSQNGVNWEFKRVM